MRDWSRCDDFDWEQAPFFCLVHSVDATLETDGEHYSCQYCWGITSGALQTFAVRL